MMKQYFNSIKLLLLFLFILVLFYRCWDNNSQHEEITKIIIYPDSILSDVSNHPVGINLDYYMDDDNFLQPERRTAKALKEMGVKYLRYPGGDKSDSYLFSTPPYEKSDPTITRKGKGCIGGRDFVLNDDYATFNRDVLDFDEFISMCREIEAEPVIVVAADGYLADYPEHCQLTTRDQLLEHAAAWVKYSNIIKKYDVKYWMIGNECWHKNNENSTAEMYAQDVIDFSKAMKAVDPTIYIIPNGNSIDFFETVIKIAGEYIDHLCLSNYPVWEYKAGYATYRDTLQDLMHPVQRALAAIENSATPEQKEKWKLMIVEYGPFDWANYWPKINNMGMNLANFEMTGEQLLIPSIDFSCFWNTRWIYNDSIDYSAYDALDKNGNFNANGYGLMIWGNYLGDKMVNTTATTHIRSFASLIPEEDRLFIYLMNKAENPKSIQLNIEGRKVVSILQAKELVGEGPDDVNPVWQDVPDLTSPEKIEIKGTTIMVLEYKLK
jgi:alpha-L-arabinofuranosidase